MARFFQKFLTVNATRTARHGTAACVGNALFAFHAEHFRCGRRRDGKPGAVQRFLALDGFARFRTVDNVAHHKPSRRTVNTPPHTGVRPPLVVIWHVM